MMNNLPDYLFDKILTFNNPIDIIKCKILNKNYNQTIKQLCNNRNSFIQKTYTNQYPLDNHITWLIMLKKLNKYTVERNTYTYKVMFRNIKVSNNNFFVIFNSLRDIYDSSVGKICELFFIFFIKNLDLFKININHLNQIERYRQETYFYYLIDIYLGNRKEKYLNYLDIIFDNLFDYVSNLEFEYECIIHRLIYNYIHQNYIRDPKFCSNLYRLIIHKIDKYKLEIIDEEDEHFDSYHLIYSDY